MSRTFRDTSSLCCVREGRDYVLWWVCVHQGGLCIPGGFGYPPS